MERAWDGMAEGIETQRHRDTEESQNCWKARIVEKQGLVERVGDEIVGDGRVGDEIVGDDSLLYSVPPCFKKGLVLR